MPVVANTEKNPIGTAHAGAQVRIRLVAALVGAAPGYVPASDYSIIGEYSTRTDGSGNWSVTLVANSLISPANTYYIADVTPKQGAAIRHQFSVPNTAGPFRVEDILSVPPANLPDLHQLDPIDAHAASAVSLAAVAGLVGDDVQEAVVNLVALDALKIPLAQRAAANGVATLDGTTKIPVGQVPDLSGTYVATSATAQTKTGPLSVTAIRTRDEPWANVRHADFAVPEGGVTDGTAALAAMEALVTAGQTIYFPKGTYKAKLQPSKGNITWKGAGMWATTIVPTAASIDYMIAWTVIGASNVTFEDMAFDMSNSTAGNVLTLAGLNGHNVIFRRCRFVNVPGRYGNVDGIDGFTVDSCLHHGNGTSLGEGWLIAGASRKVKFIGQNEFLHVGNGIGAQDSVEDMLFDGVYMDLGWYMGKSIASGSGAGVTYTATTATNPAGDFVNLGVSSARLDHLRVLTVKRTAATATFSISNHIIDAGATYVTSAVKEGDIIRSNTGVWAPVQRILSQTELVVEGWYSNTTYLASNRPDPGSTYTLYGVQMALISGVTATVLTFAFIYDLDGAAAVPAAGTLYEVIKKPNYPLHVDGQFGGPSRRVKVINSTFLRGWSDQISLFGVEAEIINNTVRRGQDYGMTLNNSPAIVIGNNVDRQGVVGIWVDGDNSEVLGNKVRGTTYSNPTLAFFSGILVTGPGSHIHGNQMDGMGLALSRYGIVAYAGDGIPLDKVTIGTNLTRGHSVSDLRIATDGNVASTVDVSLAGWTGTVTSDGTTGALPLPPLNKLVAPAGYTGRVLKVEKGGGGEALGTTTDGLVIAEDLRHTGDTFSVYNGPGGIQAPHLANLPGAATLADVIARSNAQLDLFRRWSFVANATSFAPLSIGTTRLQAWYNAQDLLLSEGATVSPWSDSSTLNRHAIAIDGVATWHGSVIDQKPVVRFSGDRFRAAWTLNQPSTVMMVAKHANLTGTQDLFDSGNGNPVFLRSNGGAWGMFAGTATIASPAVQDTNWHIFVVTFDGAASVLRIDGGAGTVGNAGTLASGGITLGNNYANPAPFNGDMAQVFVGPLTLADINNLAGYLQAQMPSLAWTTAT